MKHRHDADVNLTVDISTENLEDLVDKVVDGAITIIVVATAAHIFKELITR